MRSTTDACSARGFAWGRFDRGWSASRPPSLKRLWRVRIQRVVTPKWAAASGWVMPVMSMVSMMIFDAGFSIDSAWRNNDSRHRFPPPWGIPPTPVTDRNDLMRHTDCNNRNDLIRHPERCRRTRHCRGHKLRLDSAPELKPKALRAEKAASLYT